MTRLSLCLPYYRNPGMLEEQYRVWSSYPDALKAQIEIVLVDDGSPEFAANDVARPDGLPAIRIFRVLKDIPWHQHGARNLAAYQASGAWLLVTDMDHVLPTESLKALMSVMAAAGARDVYTFARVDAPNLRPTRNDRGELKPHVNTFLLRKSTYWSVGGYDEDAVGYGTDSYFRRALFAANTPKHLSHISVIRYPREVIADASTTVPGIDPRRLRDMGRRTLETKARMARKRMAGQPPKVMAFDWVEVPLCS
jgi:hypothetical protein